MLKALWAAGARHQHLKQASLIINVDGVAVMWQKSARRKRSLALKLDKTGQLIAMTPSSTSESELCHFVRSRRAWIDKQLKQFETLQAAKEQACGELVWFKGERLTIQAQINQPNQTLRQAGVLVIRSRQPLTPQALDMRAKKWLRNQANQLLPEYLSQISEQTGLAGSGWQIKSYTARWGSCRHDGLIQLNWKLIMAPREVIDYVIIHELCHLKDFNHSVTFWARVAQHCPAYKNQRKWLKQRGRLLMVEA